MSTREYFVKYWVNDWIEPCSPAKRQKPNRLKKRIELYGFAKFSDYRSR